MNSPTPSRPAASNFRWVICALLFFSTTFNYLDRQVISYLKEYFCTPLETDQSFSTFSANDINLPEFAAKLAHPADPVSVYLKSSLSAPTLAGLDKFSPTTPLALQTNLIRDLNGLVTNSAVYDGQRFAGLTLRPETQKLLAANPSADVLPHLNRLLLDDAYPREISRGGFGWSNTDFGNLTSFFTAFYAGMTIIAGWVIDKIGTKMGLALSLIVWSIFGIWNAFISRAVMMHVLVRSAFGVGEAGNFPASIKTVAEWFPKRERALATGIFNSGSNFGAMVAALFVPWCMIYFGDQLGWKMAFILTGAVGFFWLIFWFWLYDTPAKSKRLSQTEYDLIHSDKDEAPAGNGPAKQSKSSIGKLFTFSGRVPSASFWGTTILIGILTAFIFLMTTLIVVPNGRVYVSGETFDQVMKKIFVTPDEVKAILVFRVAWLLLAAWVCIAVQVKRWHDLGKTGWLVLINLVPGIGSLISIAVLGFSKSSTAAARFGNESITGVLGYRQTWAFFWGKFLTDGVWWFYLFWLPDYLKKQFGMDKHQVMLPTFIVYGVAIVGSVYGGSIPMTLIKRGMAVYKARMLAMFLIALAPLTVLTTQYFGNVEHFGNTWAAVLAVATICVGAAAHQAWSANLFTTVSDMFPKTSVGSVTGIGAMAGGLGGVLVQQLAGGLTDAYSKTPQFAYLIMFIMCAASYLIAWTVMKMLVPRHKPITDI
ncbi:MAG TPA: MFS transporter [Candidatus Acidoferrales bacterium]|jgi:nitrate/nitrite transporter NarK|nr:MFS transporter [Candidatus Acidoferrales bacterium]